jgi:hypothetical protein
LQAGGHRFDPDQLHQLSLRLLLKGELLQSILIDGSRKLTFEQALPKSAISKLQIQASHVRERLKARAAFKPQRSVI